MLCNFSRHTNVPIPVLLMKNRSLITVLMVIKFYFQFHSPGYLLYNLLKADVLPNELGLDLSTKLNFESLRLSEY